MEDSSLDDFFAKKDKTKKKNKSKLTPSDILAQQETGVKKTKKKKDKENEDVSEERKATNDDENWVDFEQETETDYSGLRIQNLQITNKDGEEEEEETNENEDEEDGETRQKKEELSGPWNKSTQPQSSQPAQIAMPEPPPPEPEPAKEDEPKPRKYVPPGARAGGSSSVTPSRLTARRKKTAPNLHSEDDFPTLGGGGASDVRSWGNNSDSRGDFEKVQSGGRNIDDSTKVNQQLTLGNRYSSLQD